MFMLYAAMRLQFSTKNMAASFLKAPPYAQGGGQCAGAFFEMSMGIR
jgi:hypothetical protein